MSLLMLPSMSFGADSSDKEMTLVLRAGYTSLSDVSPTGSGVGFGFDSSFAAFGDFGLGGIYYHLDSNESLTAGTSTTDFSRSFNVLAIAPYYDLAKGKMRANIGVLGGAMLTSVKSKTRHVSNETSASGTSAALGFFVSANVGIAGPVFFQLKGDYIKSTGATKMGMLTAGGGIGFYL